MRIVSEHAAGDAAWDRAAHDRPGATFFHRRDWARAWCAHFGGTNRAEAWELAFDDGARALLPLTSYVPRGQTTRRQFLSAGGTYGGPLADRPLTDAHHAAVARWLAQRGETVWRRPPAAPAPHANAADDAPAGDQVTHLMDLTRGAPAWESCWRRRGAARKARRAAEAGVQATRAAGPDDRAAYRALVQKSRARWGADAGPAYGADLFERLAACPGVALYLAHHRGRCVAGAWCFTHRGHTVYWHGAADADAFALRPVNLLMLDIARRCLARGDRWFDLNPSGGHAGVEAFKRSLGAEPWPAPLSTSTAAPAPAAAPAAVLRRAV